METTEERLDALETSMREHTHSTIDSTSKLPITPPTVQLTTTGTTITPRFEEDCVDITSLASAITFANPTGTPYNLKQLIIRVKDNGTARAITWGSMYAAAGFPLPSTTVLGKWITMGFFYNTTLTKWQLVGYAQET